MRDWLIEICCDIWCFWLCVIWVKVGKVVVLVEGEIEGCGSWVV